MGTHVFGIEGGDRRKEGGVVHGRVLTLVAVALLGLGLVACGDSSEQKVFATDVLPVAGAGGDAELLASLDGVAVVGSAVFPGSQSVLSDVHDLVPELAPAPVPAVDQYAVEVPAADTAVETAPEPAPVPVAPGYIEVRIEGVTAGYTAAAQITTADGLTTLMSLPVAGPDWTVMFSDLADGIYKVRVQLDSPWVPPDGTGVEIGSSSTVVQSDFNIGVSAGTATTVYFDAATLTFTAVQ